MKGHVVLIHGLWAAPLHMAGLARYLRKAGYRTYIFGYLSMRAPIEEHAKHLHDFLERHNLDHLDDLHLIGHSMGGLLIRAMVGFYPNINVRSIIMLGTPNQGSAWVDVWRSHPQTRQFFDFVWGPAGRQLSTNQTPFRQLYPDHLPCPVGVIAATKPIIPLSTRVLKETHDGLVTVRSTKLPDMADFTIVQTNHTHMMNDPEARRQILHFLTNYHFDHAA